MATKQQEDQENPHPPLATTYPPPVFIPTPTLPTLLTHQTLITHLHTTLPLSTPPTTTTPLRHTHHPTPSSTLLLMPSWSHHPSLPYLGIKLVTHHPLNPSPPGGVHAIYTLFSSVNGQTLASIDSTHLTLYRTACVSAIASMHLSNPNSNTLLMVGAGNLAPHLITAHLTVRSNITRVIVWNRTREKAKRVVEKMQCESEVLGNVSFEASESLDEVIGLGDIISCATNSERGLVKGGMLKQGAHLDLVGSFKPTMRECDDEALRRGRVFVDNEDALVEAGELVGAFERGVIRKDDVVGDLVELIKGEKVGRRSEEEVTVFKSVGSAVVDLLTAQLVYETYMSRVGG